MNFIYNYYLSQKEKWCCKASLLPSYFLNSRLDGVVTMWIGNTKAGEKWITLSAVWYQLQGPSTDFSSRVLCHQDKGRYLHPASPREVYICISMLVHVPLLLFLVSPFQILKIWRKKWQLDFEKHFSLNNRCVWLVLEDWF